MTVGRASLRARIVLAATGVVAVALVIGAVLFVLLFQWSLQESLRSAAESDASTITNRLDSTGVVSLTPEERDDDDRLFQLMVDGTVVDASEEADDLGALAGDELDTWITVEVDGDRYLVVAEDADDAVVVAGRELDDVDEAMGVVVPLVAVAVPLLLALVALTVWLVVGRALRPVERMRREVDAVTATSLERRIAQPAASDEISRLAATMNRMLQRLDDSQRAQRRFISDASHELKSPLASLRQYAEVAASYPDRMSATDLADAIRDEGGRLEAIVRGMLVLARADENSLEPSRVEVDLDDILLAEAARLRDSTALAVDSSGVGAGRVNGSPELLAQVVRNLADNAARHAASRIGLSLVEADGLVTLAVDDDGPGIPSSERERVFERFVRLDDARARDSGGSGLGLAIVRELAAAHGGSVHLETSVLGGARVEVRLPASS